MLLGVAQMIVVTSGKGAIDISQKYILTLAAYVSCELMQHNILLCQQLRGYIKRRPVNPVFFIHPLHTALIEPVKRIIYQFVIHQVCIIR